MTVIIENWNSVPESAENISGQIEREKDSAKYFARVYINGLLARRGMYSDIRSARRALKRIGLEKVKGES